MRAIEPDKQTNKQTNLRLVEKANCHESRPLILAAAFFKPFAYLSPVYVCDSYSCTKRTCYALGDQPIGYSCTDGPLARKNAKTPLFFS